MHVAVYNVVTAVCEEELWLKPARLISRLLRTNTGGEHSMILVCSSNAVCSPSWQVQCICTAVLEATG